MASKQPRSAKYYLNAVHTLFELILRRPSPTNVPIYCLHEPTTGCNLECPACPTGVGLANLKETAELEDYEAVCSELLQRPRLLMPVGVLQHGASRLEARGAKAFCSCCLCFSGRRLFQRASQPE